MRLVQKKTNGLTTYIFKMLWTNGKLHGVASIQFIMKTLLLSFIPLIAVIVHATPTIDVSTLSLRPTIIMLAD